MSLLLRLIKHNSKSNRFAKKKKPKKKVIIKPQARDACSDHTTQRRSRRKYNQNSKLRRQNWNRRAPRLCRRTWTDFPMRRSEKKAEVMTEKIELGGVKLEKMSRSLEKKPLLLWSLVKKNPLFFKYLRPVWGSRKRWRGEEFFI